ncbi:MarR family transcriptional regulator [Chloroflexales bacterium ZM16-3]|nr:MarR family transcriptional regulator [Chloroflexales bacterium ZM16-3]
MPPEPHPLSDPKADLIETVFELHRQLFLTLQNTAIPRWMQLELTMAQFKTLFVVARRGPFTVNALAEVLGVTQSTVSHLVDRLESVALVERVADADDRRRTMVQLAPAGAELIETLQQGRREHIHALLGCLDLADLAALVRGLSAILRVNQTAANTSISSK